MSDTQIIKDRVDLVQLISEYIQLKKAGVSWKACCPFHNEKSPSFIVNAEKQFWHCFGCGKSGDIFTFLQEIEGLEFPEALKILAERAGVEIKTFKKEIDKSQKNRLFEVNNKATYFFHNFLLSMPTAKIARDYLKNRGTSDEAIVEWQVGFVPDQWDLLTKYLLKNGFGVEDIVSTGLVVKNENKSSYYDRFRGRIMFPIKDVYGNIIGFTGRIIVETENSGGKYVNTPQTPIFDKSRAVYGIDKAKMAIKAKDEMILVEGQMDVIANHIIGIKNVVAASGTALTEDHIRLLKRYSQNILFAFDADEAGIKAAKRGIDLALLNGLNVKIISIPEGKGKDADECIKKYPGVWTEAVAKAQGVMEWYFSEVFTKHDINDPRGRQQISDELLPEINKIQYAIEKEAWLKKLSDKLGVDVNILKEDTKRLVKLVYASKPIEEEKPQVQEEKTRLDDLLERFWAIIIKYPKGFIKCKNFIKKEFFVDNKFLPLYEFAENEYNKGVLDFGKFNHPEQENLINLLYLRAEKEFSKLDDEELEKEIEALLAEIKKEWLKIQKEKLTFALKRAQEAGDKQQEDEILNLVMKLNSF
jgi:DNA primase